MKHLYFMRHGFSKMNALSIYSGSNDTPLTKEGEQQCKEAAKQLAKLDIQLIVSSPMKRALDSAKIIAKEIGYPEDRIVLCDLFMERDFGPLEGTDYNIKHKLDEVEGVEHSNSVINRAKAGLDLVNSLDADNILIVSHGAIGRALKHLYDPGSDYHKIEGIKNAEIIKLL